MLDLKSFVVNGELVIDKPHWYQLKNSHDIQELKDAISDTIDDLELPLVKYTEQEAKEDFDELEYTGPDEGEVYDRFEKIQKTFKSYIKAINKYGYLDGKTVEAREEFSQFISELRLAPKLVSTMIEVVSHRVNEVKKEENIIRQACFDAGMTRQLFYDSFPGNE